jgi:hypothetical protein
LPPLSALRLHLQKQAISKGDAGNEGDGDTADVGAINGSGTGHPTGIGQTLTMETLTMETRSIKTRSIKTRSIKTRSIKTRSIKTRSIKTRSIKSKSDSLMPHDAAKAAQLAPPDIDGTNSRATISTPALYRMRRAFTQYPGCCVLGKPYLLR